MTPYKLTSFIQISHINVNVFGIKLVAYDEHDYFGNVSKEFQILT